MRRFTSPGLKSAAWILALAALASAGDARADWPNARHDARRTGVANGTSDIQKPVVAWSAYLGGRVTSTSLLVHDLDGDAKGEILSCGVGVVSGVRRLRREQAADRLHLLVPGRLCPPDARRARPGPGRDHGVHDRRGRPERARRGARQPERIGLCAARRRDGKDARALSLDRRAADVLHRLPPRRHRRSARRRAGLRGLGEPVARARGVGSPQGVRPEIQGRRGGVARPALELHRRTSSRRRQASRLPRSPARASSAQRCWRARRLARCSPSPRATPPPGPTTARARSSSSAGRSTIATR